MDKLAAAEARRNKYLERRARSAFRQGVFSLVAPFVGLSLLGILFAILAIRRTRRESEGVMTPAIYKKLSTAKLLGIFGLITSIIVTVITVVALIVLVALGVPVVLGIVTAVFGFIGSILTWILGVIAALVSAVIPLVAPALAVAIVAFIEELIAKILGEGLLLIILFII